jgi:hypothetical protein
MYQEEVKIQALADIAGAQALRKVAEAALTKMMKPDKDGNMATDAEIKAAAVLVDAMEVPVVPRLLTDDATPEALASLMMEQGGRIAILSAEGDAFDLMAGRYSSSDPHLGIYLKGHSGDAHYLDRKGREPEFIQRPALTLSLAVQPMVLVEVGQNRKFRGRGLLARFVYSLPEDLVGYRDSDASPVNPIIQDRYSDKMDTLIKAMMGLTAPMVLTLAPEASKAVVAFLTRLEVRLRPDSDLGSSPLTREWASKLVGQSVRVAGLLHLAEHLGDAHRHPIDAATMLNAIDIAEGYFIPHAMAAFGLMGEDPARINAEAILSWIISEELEAFSKRDAYNAHRSRFPRAEDIDGPLRVLEDHGWIARDEEPPRSGAGRRPSPKFTINPLTQNTHNTQNP